MSRENDDLVDGFAQRLKAEGLAIRHENNLSLLKNLEENLSKRLPPSFESLLSRYSFPSFDFSGITVFEWDAGSKIAMEAASVPGNPMSDALLPAGFFQFGRPDTGSFDAVCFDMNAPCQNREYRIVLADHEEILCNNRVRIRCEISPSFRKLLES